MTTGTESTDTPLAASVATPVTPVVAPPSWPWRRAALLLAAAAGRAMAARPPSRSAN
jgi:hypothetical protein